VFISHAWDYKSEYDGVVNLLNADYSFKWVNLSVPIDDPLPVLMGLPKSHRHIVRQLDEKIRQTDCLLVLAAMYVAHRGWIQSEIEAALEFKKPIIAVKPRGQERVPEPPSILVGRMSTPPPSPPPLNRLVSPPRPPKTPLLVPPSPPLPHITSSLVDVATIIGLMPSPPKK
jgi:hypothetical protein